ncbi:MAG TPA: response regulator transcription factor [Candidatus Dormibacteraeota bacterium]|jgi:DNA-binding response OmpR family regulator
MKPSLVAESATLSSPADSRGRILVIDDEHGIRNFVSRGLCAEGYTVDVAADGAGGLNAAISEPYDLVILDLLMPGLNGTDVLHQLVQRKPGQSVIVLSALTDTASKVNALDLGAEDYLAKPFSLEELLARVKVRLRHAQFRQVFLGTGGLKLDLIRRQVEAPGGRVTLAEREFLLLRELMTRAGDTLSKEHLLAAVWGYRFDPGSNVVDVYVRRLRAKLGGNAIKTIRGEGYRIDAA